MSHSWSKFKHVEYIKLVEVHSMTWLVHLNPLNGSLRTSPNMCKLLTITYTSHLSIQRFQVTTRWSGLQSHLPANPYARHHRSSAWFAFHWSNLWIPGSWNSHFHHPSRSWWCWPSYRSPGSGQLWWQWSCLRLPNSGWVWQSLLSGNMAMERIPYTLFFPFKPPFIRGLSIAIFDYRRVSYSQPRLSVSFCELPMNSVASYSSHCLACFFPFEFE